MHQQTSRKKTAAAASGASAAAAAVVNGDGQINGGGNAAEACAERLSPTTTTANGDREDQQQHEPSTAAAAAAPVKTHSSQIEMRSLGGGGGDHNFETKAGEADDEDEEDEDDDVSVRTPLTGEGGRSLNQPQVTFVGGGGLASPAHPRPAAVTTVVHQGSNSSDQPRTALSLAGSTGSDTPLPRGGGGSGRRDSCFPLLFERAAPSWWHPQFDSPILERQYWRSTLPRTTRRFQFGLLYLFAMFMLLAFYFASVRTRHWPTFMGEKLSLLKERVLKCGTVDKLYILFDLGQIC